ncbi:hypothetical protein LXM60_21080 [Pandoraea sputorum]|uniref:hypothetical protein n=1 Tax=Pandoraea sputorum TaxID=93222 RepID=UPI001E4923B9|nr:hypothetical protein [Pandoraea sputorum]MCE4062700.1 hypothetical protein [Pandoraea sputorum]
MAYVTPFYRGFRLETFVVRECDSSTVERKRDEALGVTVRVSQTSESDLTISLNPKLFQLDTLPFDSIGDARRAGDEFGRSIVDDIIRQSEAEAS